MDDGEGGLSFDFEGGLDSGPSNPTASVPVVQPNAGSGVANNMAAAAAADPTPGNYSGRRSFRQTVCRHWLRGLCMKADNCGFLHQYDKARMPICRFYRLYGECREADCVYKHTDEDIKECNMYKLGFCPNGPDCRYRHIKLPGPPPPVEEVLQRIQQQAASYNYGNFNRFNQNRNGSYHQQAERPPLAQDSGAANQGVAAKSSTTEFPNMTPQQQAQPSLQQVGQGQLQSVPNGQHSQENKISTPLPEGISRYFIVKSCNRENLEVSVQQGVWATQRSNEAKLNEAFDSVENVILIFSVNTTRHFQGCAKMTSKIAGAVSGGNWKYAHGGAHFGRNFSVKWLKLCELSFHKTRHLRNPLNENLPVKISRDCQELEPFIGEQLASLLYLEPDSELMAISVAAEAKREEEKAKGTNLENAAENPDIVPFEDNDDEEEEESEDEEDESYEAYQASQGRGRGRGPMWPSNFPLGRGARPILGMRGFPPVMMGPDGFPYGGMRPDGFPMPDLFGAGPRPFAPPYGPRFPGDFGGPAPGMMFHGRPQPGGYGMGMGMAMGPGRGGPFMGAPPGRGGGRPVGMPPMFQAPPPPSRDPKGPPQNNDKMNRHHSGGGSDSGKGKEIAAGSGDNEAAFEHGVKTQHEDHQSGSGAGNGFRNDDSGSEDEAPRRSRHGEAKKKRRSSDQQ